MGVMELMAYANNTSGLAKNILKVYEPITFGVSGDGRWDLYIKIKKKANIFLITPGKFEAQVNAAIRRYEQKKLLNYLSH